MSCTPYDRVPYPSRPFWVTHPYSLGAIATLYGMQPAPVERCRVLEVGCGEGGNLVPMAASLPGSTFVGFDLAGEAVRKGQEFARELSLPNLELKTLDLMDAGSDLGEFDYLIAHGLYTWVPPAIQDKLLQLCQDVLAPQGVAYISYNVYPGGFVREAVRDLMLLHTTGVEDPYRRVKEARSFLEILAEGRRKPDPWDSVVKQELENLQKCSPEQVFHDEFATEYHQVYFKDFIARAREHRLDYLAEAELADMTPFGFGDRATETLEALSAGDRIRWEQYLDFFRFRKFRRTLLCRQDTAHRDKPDPQALRGLYLSSGSQPAESGQDRWKGPDNAVIQIVNPEVSRVLQRLSRAWPLSIAASELLGEVPGTEEAILELCTIKFIQVQTWAPPAVRVSTGKPYFSRLVRRQAAGGEITNLYHQGIHIDGDLATSLLQLADGTRDRNTLIAELKFRHPNHSAAEIARGFDRQLQELARLALLTHVEPGSGPV